MRYLVFLCLLFSVQLFSEKIKHKRILATEIPKYPGYKLMWNDEFNTSNVPDSLFWNFESGFVRNHEDQWYQKQNAFCENGKLIIEGRKEKFINSRFDSLSHNWKKKRKFIEYTSSSINTNGKYEFLYGRIEVCARIDTATGLWPAIWTLGKSGEWPSCGEIDIMESYPINNVSNLLLNTAFGTEKRYTAKWKSKKIDINFFISKDNNWLMKFHVWQMDWDENSIKILIDKELIFEHDITDVKNQDGSNPFRQPHYLLLNLAIGGDNGGNPSRTTFPRKYEIDYVRIYQKED